MGFIALILAFAGLAVAQIGGFLAGSSEPPSLARTLPARIEVLEGGRGDPWRLFDGDTARGFQAAAGGAHLRLLLDKPRDLAAVGVFGPVDGRLTVSAEQEGVPVEIAEIAGVPALSPGWHRVRMAPPVSTRALLLDWQPATAGAVLPEIELWSAVETGAADGSRIALGSPAALRIGAVGAGGEGTVRVRLAVDPGTVSRAYLSYELTGLAHWSAAVRSINGHPAQGFGARPAAGSALQPALQMEEIDPSWLRSGMNEIRFSTARAENVPEILISEQARLRSADAESAAETVPYEIRNPRLILVAETGRSAAAGPWNGAGRLDVPLAQPAQPFALEITLPERPRGVLTAEARLAGGVAPLMAPLFDPLDLSALGAGRHVLTVREDLPAAAAVQLTWKGAAGKSGDITGITGIAVLASPVARRQGPRLVLTHPPAGDAAEQGAYLRGFVDGPAGVRGTPVLFVDGAAVPEAVAADGALGVLVPRPQGAEGTTEGAWDISLDLRWPDGSRLTRTLRLGQGAGDADDPESSPEVERDVAPDKAKSLSLRGASLELPAGAVDRNVKVTMRALRLGDLPALDSGMTNVTPGQGGFRFGPHGQKFRKPLRLTIPYDPALIPQGLTADDVRTYFFDTSSGRWTAVPRLAVAAAKVVSATDHFTDFINATLTLPEEPAGASFNPNSLQELAKADPGAEIELIAAPTGGPTGDAALSYPLVVPKGRRGLQPELAVAYSSGGGGNGWLGVGWDLRLPSIEVATLFGVPRYDGARETETYALDGSQLAPVANPANPAPRQAERAFTRRIEGSFERIVRHGGGPASYWWEVTDQRGVRSIYGRTAQARLADPGSGNTFQWVLEQTIDLHGNTVDYTYSHDSGGGGAAGEPWVQIYPREITWTGVNGSGGFYHAQLVLDDGQQRPDRFSSGRSGFKVETRRRLARVDVLAGEDLVRRYLFEYREGDFRKSLLAAVAVTGEDGSTELARHSFDYQHADAAFGGTESWGGIGGAKDCTASFNVAGGVHAYVGLGPPICMPLVGVQAGASVGGTTELASLLDVNGDGLPDRIDDQGNVDLNRQGSFAPASMSGVSDIGRTLEFTFDVSAGFRADISGTVPVSGGASFVYTHANEDRMFLDVNGDGLPDLVGSDGGFHTRLNNGTAFLPAASWGGFGSGGLSLGRPEEAGQVLGSLHLSDTLTRLRLPFTGAVTLDGAIRKKQAGGDGVRVEIFHNDTRIWRRTFAAGDVAPCVPAAGDSCGGGLSLDVDAGDRVYFLTDSIRETSADALLWTPRATYDGQDLTALEPWGAPVYRFDGGEDFRLAGPPGGSWLATGNGTAQVQGALVKQATTDDVTVAVLKNGFFPVYHRTFAAAETGSFDEIPAIAVAKNDHLSFQVTSTTPVDPDRVRWTPQVTLDGDQPAALRQPQKAQVYDAIPRLAPSDQPTRSWTVPADWGQTGGSLHFERPASISAAVLYVQGLHRLFERRSLPAGSASFDLTVDAAAGEPLWVTLLGDGDLTVTAGSDTVPVNVRSIAEATTEALSGGWHGWSYGEWNGDKPFREDGLELPEDEDDDKPDAVLGVPHWEGTTGLSEPAWAAGGFDLYMAAEGVKPSRLGGNAAADLDTSTGFFAGGGLGVLRKTTGYTGGANLSSLAINSGDSTTEVDVLDMNGDRYPDQVSGSGVRFSDGRSGFAGLQSFPGLDSAVRRSENGNASLSIGLGTIFSKAAGGGKVKALASTLPTIGSTVSLSQTRYDLIDVNGDGLPDRVTMNSGATGVLVQLNLGYRFGAPEIWPLPNWEGSDFTHGVGGCNDVISGAGTALGQMLTNVASPNALSFTRSSGFTAGASFGPLGAGGSTTLARTLVQLADVNGDGLADHVAKEHGENFFRVKLNHGDGWDPEQHWPIPDWSTALGGGYAIPGVMSCLDAVSYSGNIAANVSAGFATCFVIIPPAPVVGLEVEVSGQVDGSGGGLQLSFQDVDGDGLPDHVLKKRDDPTVYVKPNLARKANLLTAVQRPLGGSFQLTYARQGNRVGLSADNLRKVDMPDTQWVLAAVTENDGRGNSYTSRYDYFDESYHDRAERESYGYARVKTTRPDGSTIDRRFQNQDFYQRHLQTSEEIADASGRVFRTKVSTYAPRPAGPGAVFPALVREETFFFEGTGSAHKSIVRAYDYDSFGNVIAFTDSGEQGNADDVAATAAYAADPQTYFNQPSRLEVRDGAGRRLRERSATYSPLGDLVRLEQVLIGGKDPATGSPYSGSNNAVRTYTYDAVGNLASATDPSGFTSTFTYDSTLRTFPAQVSDSFGYTSRFTWNLLYGKLAETVDKNGQSMRRAYDAFGRLVRVAGPDDTDASPALAFEYAPAARPARAVSHHKDVTRSDTIDTAVFIDGLGRTLQTKEDADLDLGSGSGSGGTRTGMQVSGHVDFDLLGRVAAQGQPIFDTGALNAFVATPALNPTQFSYDALDRVTEARFPHGAVTRMAYGFSTLDGVERLAHTRTDANGKSTLFYDDVQGNVVGIRQTNTIAGAARTLITRYAYDALQQLTAVTDPEGNVTQIENDTLGRRVAIVSPDSGRTEMRFTPAGDLGAKVTANLAAQGRQIRYLRTFHRLDRIDYPSMPDVLFTYGGPGAPGYSADRITSVTDESGVEQRSYDRLGNLAQSVRTATSLNGTSPKGPYTTTSRYDSFGRLLSMVYPDGEQVTWGYDAGGKVKTAAGVQAGVRFEYLRHQGYDEFGQKVRTVFGNGVEARTTYDAKSRELKAIEAWETGGRKFQSLSYNRDSTGTLLSLQNDVPPGRATQEGGPVNETFLYDDLYQLVGATGSSRSANNKVTSFALTLAYDEGGDLVAKNQLHEVKGKREAKTSYNQAYVYGGPQPHAATHIGDRTFHYDLSGNQLGWDSDSNGTRRADTWDEENRLKAVADNGQTNRFLYDSAGTRTNKAGQGGETIYVNRWFSVTNGNKLSKHVFADGVRLVSKVGAGANPNAAKVYFYHPDHLGSTEYVSDERGATWQHLEYFPSGEVWVDERSQTDPAPYLFSGKELDEETGLSSFGFRYYDARQGQWTSADPIFDGMLDSGKLAQADLSSMPFRRPGLVYGYVANSPTNLVDATGLVGGSAQGEHVFNAVGSLGDQIADQITASLQEAGGQALDNAGPAIAALRARSRSFTDLRDHEEFRSADQGDPGNAGLYGEFSREVTGVVARMVSGQKRASRKATRQLDRMASELEGTAIDQTARTARRDDLAARRRGSFDGWYDQTKGKLNETFGAIKSAALAARSARRAEASRQAESQ